MEKGIKTEATRKVTDYMVNYDEKTWHMAIEHFDWMPGVGLYGIWNAYKFTGDVKYMEFLKGWFSRHLKEAYEKKTVNSTAPLLTAVYMYEENGAPELLKVCTDIAEFIINEAPLTKDGGLEHTVTTEHGFSDQVWADTLFMACLFLAKFSIVTGEKKYADFCAKQLIVHHKLLSDGKGLYFHGYDGANKNHMSAVRWGRANSWITYSTAEILRLLPDIAERHEAEEYLRAQAEALIKVQTDDGGFRTILDDETSYVEISATAAIAAGLKLGTKLGILDEKFNETADKAIDATMNSILPNGAVDGVSMGTPVMPDADGYKEIGIAPTLYGQGLAALAFSI